MPFSKESLKEGLQVLGIPFTPEQINTCESFYLEYKKQMEFLNISSLQTSKEFIEKHLLDSLSPHVYLNPYSEIADLGSGGGFPGIALAIFFPNKFVTLIDVIEKKVLYLKHMVAFLSLSNVKVFNASKQKVKGSFDLIVCRAVGSLKKILLYAKPYCNPYTHILCYKGKKETIQQELKELKSPLSYTLYPIKVPFLEAERNIILIKDL